MSLEIMSLQSALTTTKTKTNYLFAFKNVSGNHVITHENKIYLFVFKMCLESK
jgi:hypothetical protein